jgi:phosphoglycerate-specific signal transduction histidine kinase
MEPGQPGGTAAGASGDTALDLVHELIDCLAAISAYAEAMGKAQTAPPPIGPDRLGEALEKLTGQVGRAGRVAHRLREALRPPPAPGAG